MEIDCFAQNQIFKLYKEYKQDNNLEATHTHKAYTPTGAKLWVEHDR